MINSKNKFNSIFFLNIPFMVFLINVLVTGSISAQVKTEVKGIILDQSNYPVPYVAVGIVKKHIGTASTDDGEFSFLITNAELKDTLSISSLGFDPFKIKIEDYLKQEKNEIILKETTTELNEVVLLKPSDYVINALKSLKDNTLSQPHKIELLYRRAATEEGKAKFFVENYIKIRDRGPAYSMGTVEVSEARKSADYRVWKRNQWRHSIHDLFHVNPLVPNDSQHARNLKKFIWKKTGDTSYEGEDVLILRGQNPKLKWEHITLYVGIDTYKVFRIERGNSLYVYKKHQSGRMVLSYFRNQWNFPKNMIPNDLLGTAAETLEYKTEAFVYNVETEKKKIRVNPFGVETDMGSLDLPYNSSFWKNLSTPPDTEFYKKIKSQLEENYGVSLEKQFELVNK